MNDIISTFNDLYYKIQISHNICLADVRNICLKSYNNSVVCDVDGVSVIGNSSNKNRGVLQ